MSKNWLRLAAASAAAATVLALGTVPALAATTFTVANGGMNLPAAAQGNFTLVDGTNTFTCPAGAFKVTILNGIGLSGIGIGTIPAISFGGCTGPLSINVTVTPVGTPKINAVSITGGIVSGTITGVDLKLSSTLCTAEITGTVDFSYNSGTGVFTISPDGNLLTVKSASCLGILNTGDVVKLNGSFKLKNTPYIDITSP
jgi:hypothetical protein